MYFDSNEDRASARVYDVAMGDVLGRKIHIHPKTINPHVDVASLNTCAIYIRNVEGCEQGGNLQDPPTMARKQLACVYHGDGTCAGLLHTTRLWILSWLHSSALLPQQPPFAEAVAKLCQRYAPPGARHSRDAPPPANPLPPEVTDTLLTAFKCSTERMATPLTVRPSTVCYWSASCHDTEFGAHTTRSQ